jgi:hypothetical protein
MIPSHRIRIGFGVLLVVSLTLSVFLLEGLDRIRADNEVEEVLFIPSPRVLKYLSLGYTGLLADVYWTRAVQYFGDARHSGNEHMRLLAPLLDIATALDPKLVVAYDFGSSFLAPPPPNGAGEPERAVELVNFGIKNNPDQWRLYYDLGFIEYMERKDYRSAAEAFLRGSEQRGAHPWLKVLASEMATHAGEINMARALWLTTYQTTQDRDIRANALAHLRALQVDEDVTVLEGAVERYRQKTGHPPATFAELVDAGVLAKIPLDPFKHPYKLTGAGSIAVGEPDYLPFIQKGIPEGYVPPKKPKFLAAD